MGDQPKLKNQNEVECIYEILQVCDFPPGKVLKHQWESRAKTLLGRESREGCNATSYMRKEEETERLIKKHGGEGLHVKSFPGHHCLGG